MQFLAMGAGGEILVLDECLCSGGPAASSSSAGVGLWISPLAELGPRHLARP